MDGTGTVYVADFGGKRVVKLAAGATTQAVLPFDGLQGPIGVAVDSAGRVSVTDYFNNAAVTLAAGSCTQTALPFTGLTGPEGAAVDTAGSVYVVDSQNNRVVKLSPPQSTAPACRQTVLPFTGLDDPWAVAVDNIGNVYVVNNTSGDHRNRVIKLAAGSDTQTDLRFTGLGFPERGGRHRRQHLRRRQQDQSSVEVGARLQYPDRAAVFRHRPRAVAVDTAGDVFVTDYRNHRLLKLAAGSNTPTVLPFTGLSDPWGLRWTPPAMSTSSTSTRS